MDTIITPDNVQRKLGCLPFVTFPNTFRVAADLPQAVLSLDSIKAELATRPDQTAWKRRQRFNGRKYIRNQGQFGSCNGWSTAGMMSRIRELRGEPYVCLSGADAYSQMNGGHDNGSILSDGLIVCKNGIAPESLVPADRIYTRQIPALAVAARANYRGLEAIACDTEEEFATGILMGECGIVAVHATNAFNNQDSEGLNAGGNGPGNHSVGVQDIRIGRSGNIQYDMANSWDVTWGDEGYTWLEWNKHLRETVKNHRFWLLINTNDDTSDSSVPPKIS